MKICFKVFHISEDRIRTKFSVAMTKYLKSNNCEILNTPTVSIKNTSNVKEFLKNNNFNLDPNGYNLDNVQGWKYGEIGIWASNYLAWENFLKTDNDLVILMEDDIKFNENFIHDLLDKINELPDEWDFFSYFVPSDQHNKYIDTMSVSNSISKIYQDWSMLCYLVSRSGAKKLIESCQSPVSLPLDWHIYRQRDKFNSYSIKPEVESMCDIANIESTFQNKQSRGVLNGIL